MKPVMMSVRRVVIAAAPAARRRATPPTAPTAPAALHCTWTISRASTQLHALPLAAAAEVAREETRGPDLAEAGDEVARLAGRRARQAHAVQDAADVAAVGVELRG